MPPEEFRSPAWRLAGLTGSQPGWLELSGGRLSYSDDDGTLFVVQVHEVSNIRFPWYYFCGGVKFTIGKEHYRLSFVRPNSAPGSSVIDIGEGRRNGKTWKAILLSKRW